MNLGQVNFRIVTLLIIEQTICQIFYKKLVEKHKIDPNLCVFVEDIARNLKPAYEMGMKTVWIENDEPWAKKFSDANFISFKTNNLSEFLKKINLLKAA